eukprot:7207939-Pyramimonas_sp.AAC.1
MANHRTTNCVLLFPENPHKDTFDGLGSHLFVNDSELCGWRPEKAPEAEEEEVQQEVEGREEQRGDVGAVLGAFVSLPDRHIWFCCPRDIRRRHSMTRFERVFRCGTELRPSPPTKSRLVDV